MNAPRVKLTELREYRSERTGNTYFSGYLGKARVVMLRDDRAECTGKEVARWSVLLEEPEPREGRDGPSSGAADRPCGDRYARRGARPANLPVSAGSRTAQRYRESGTPQASRGGNTAAERTASDLLHETGIDPGSEMSRDEMPF
ncbi:hypothetical protein MKK63_24755 [Methylobacterium sp. J-088]|uniref:hypothetical protein n=1 Tax=Methylobacterium sp. J-088 TaxID=2836664 RepID=UPI001FBAFF06|nr:hypothetical protein [Methylobacterium sp. J-088]MCJ2065892.1 hypothetical protein [Methylobacterium sp. J-088]